MAETAGYAMLAHSMDQQAAQLGQARHSLEAMTQYAQKLQAGNQTLYRYFLERDEALNTTRQALAEMTADRDRLVNECQQLTREKTELERSLNAERENAGDFGEQYTRDGLQNLRMQP
jgi:chromosome segregation ATPase